MKTNFVFKIVIILFLLVLILGGCKQSTTEPTIQNIILMNESFETNDISTLQWRFGNKELAQLINEAPNEGGSWSLQLTSDGAPTTGFIYKSVPNVNSGDIIKLSAFVRVVGNFPGKGIITLSVGPNYYSKRSKSSYSSDTVWNQIAVIDTLKLEVNDTLWVILSSPITDFVPYQQLFDMVKLEKITK